MIVPKDDINEEGSLLIQVEEIVQQIKEPSKETTKYMMKVHEKKMEYQIIEHILKNVALDKVSLFELCTELEKRLNDILSLFQIFCSISKFTKEFKKKYASVEKELTEQLKNVTIQPRSVQIYYPRIKHLM